MTSELSGFFQKQKKKKKKKKNVKIPLSLTLPPPPQHRLNNEENAPKLTPNDTKKMHRESVDFLTKELKEAGERGEEVVVLSHHCPVENLACSHPNEVLLLLFIYLFIFFC